MTDKPAEAVALTDTERIDRLENAVQIGLNIDLGEFDTPEHQAQNKAAADEAAAAEAAATQADAEAAAAAANPDAPAAAPDAAAAAGDDSGLPISDYNNQTIESLGPVFATLTAAELDQVEAYEIANANRVGVLDLGVKRHAELDAAANPAP